MPGFPTKTVVPPTNRGKARRYTSDILKLTLRVFWPEEDVENDEGGADGDGGVRDVEGGPMVGAEEDFEEIGDRAVDDAVGEIAGGAAEEEREAGGVEGRDVLAAHQEPGEDSDYGE